MTGCTNTAVTGWLNARQGCSATPCIVVIDAHAGYRAIREGLPHVTIVADHFRLAGLGYKTVS